MADEFEEWDFIGDADEWEVASGIAFTPPVSKSSAVLPPPSIRHHPRSPARLQVPAALQQLSASRGAVTTEHISHTSCRLTVHDVTSHEQKKFGTHLASPNQVSDLHPGVNDRPVRTGYQPQSCQLQSKPPKILQKDVMAVSSSADLPPEPVILQQMDEPQGPGKVKARQRRGGSKSQLNQMVRLRQPSDSPLITGKLRQV